jgi:hypothetical protein
LPFTFVSRQHALKVVLYCIFLSIYFFFSYSLVK